MQLLNIPVKVSVQWGTNAGAAYINGVPNASQIGVTGKTGYASWSDGFVPANDVPLGAGGVPPRIKDVNGVLNQISSWTKWFNAGGPLVYDPTFAFAVGGYPLNAVLQSAVQGLFVQNLLDSNTADPASSNSNWAVLFANALSGIQPGVGVPVASDLNATTLNGASTLGWVNYNASTANAPSPGGSGVALLISTNGSAVPTGSQFLFHMARDISGSTWQRQNASNGGWSAWVRLITSDQFSSGSNANGFWRIEPDGLITQSGFVLVNGNGSNQPQQTFNFPIPFKSVVTSAECTFGAYVPPSSGNIGIDSTSLTQFVINNSSPSGTNGTHFRFEGF